MSVTWTVRADAISSRPGCIGAPANYFGEPSSIGVSHVRVFGVDDQKVVLRLFPTGNPHGDQLIVEPGILALGEGETLPARVEALSSADYRRHWLLQTRSGRLALLGLLLIAIGQVIQMSLDLGEVWAWFSVGPEGVAFAKAARGGLTISGAVLALYQTLLRS